MRQIELSGSVSAHFGMACRAALLVFGSLSAILIRPPAAITQGVTSDEGPWLAGAYSFSDELGGFRIRSASGTGTKADPIVIGEELYSASPVTLVIRATKPIRAFDFSGEYANGFIYLRMQVMNASDLGWVEFEFELQEILGEPSLFGDGLSFDQRRSDAEAISSSSFAHFDRDFEPYDRLLFTNGKIDPRRIGSFGFLVTDYTPTSIFYLVQDPRIPST